MGRKTVTPSHEVLPAPVYISELLGKFIRRMMLNGKKAVSSKIVYGALDIVGEKSGENPLEYFVKALENVKPLVEVKSRRVGGATYQVPVEVKEQRREALGMRWIINASRARNGRSMSEKLAAELFDAVANTGAAFKKKEDTHRMAEANKAFSSHNR